MISPSVRLKGAQKRRKPQSPYGIAASASFEPHLPNSCDTLRDGASFPEVMW